MFFPLGFSEFANSNLYSINQQYLFNPKFTSKIPQNVCQNVSQKVSQKVTSKIPPQICTNYQFLSKSYHAD